MISICMLVKDRPRLTRQALESLRENATGEWNLVIHDDCSMPETTELVYEFAKANNPKVLAVRSDVQVGPGIARNAAISCLDLCFLRDGPIYSSDSDCFFLPGWDKALLAAWPIAKEMGFKALGGYAHPYQQPISTKNGINELAALGLLSWLMDWDTFDHYGPFDPSPDINGSEDWLYSQKIRRDGFKVGVLAEPVIINCGATSSNGKPCPGASTLYEQKIPPGVLIL